MNHSALKILRFEELKALFKVSRSTLDRWEKLKDNPFPKRIKLGENAIGWQYNEVHKWLEERSKI